jgi:hypothetical protein
LSFGDVQIQPVINHNDWAWFARLAMSFSWTATDLRVVAADLKFLPNLIRPGISTGLRNIKSSNFLMSTNPSEFRDHTTALGKSSVTGSTIARTAKQAIPACCPTLKTAALSISSRFAPVLD